MQNKTNDNQNAVLDAVKPQYMVSQNEWGNWYGYVRKQRDTYAYWERVEQFFNAPSQTQEEAAQKWLESKTA